MRTRRLVGPALAVVAGVALLLLGAVVFGEVSDGGSPAPGGVLLLLGVLSLTSGLLEARRVRR